MLKYIQIVSISDSSRKEIYGNTKHNNFKWGTEFHRVFLSDVFGDYIPSFNYLVVPLNKYSKQDLIEKNDEPSLIFLINQLQSSSEFHDLKDIPKEYTEHLTDNTPDYLLKIIGKVIAVLLHKLNVPDEEVYDITDQITRREFSMMFDNFQAYDVQEARRISREEGQCCSLHRKFNRLCFSCLPFSNLVYSSSFWKSIYSCAASWIFFSISVRSVTSFSSSI